MPEHISEVRVGRNLAGMMVSIFLVHLVLGLTRFVVWWSNLRSFGVYDPPHFFLAQLIREGVLPVFPTGQSVRL